MTRTVVISSPSEGSKVDSLFPAYGLSDPSVKSVVAILFKYGALFPAAIRHTHTVPIPPEGGNPSAGNFWSVLFGDDGDVPDGDYMLFVLDPANPLSNHDAIKKFTVQKVKAKAARTKAARQGGAVHILIIITNPAGGSPVCPNFTATGKDTNGVTQVSYTLTDSSGHIIRSGTAHVNSLGNWSINFLNIPVGTGYTLTVTDSTGDSKSSTFDVALGSNCVL
jgi:hypothetical protein